MKAPLKFDPAREHSVAETPIKISDATGKVVCTLPFNELDLANLIVDMVNGHQAQIDRTLEREVWLGERNRSLDEYNNGRFANAPTR